MSGDLKSAFRAAGIRPGDTLLVHSSLSAYLEATGSSPSQVLDDLLSVVGVEFDERMVAVAGGNLVLPTYNFDWSSADPNGEFWTDSTPSRMGVLTEIGRQHPAALRTRHPFYSVAVIGPDAPTLTKVDTTSYGPGSIFGHLTRRDAWIAAIGLDYLHSWTFVHHVEEALWNENPAWVPYRNPKTFTGLVDGKPAAFTMLAREPWAVNAVNAQGELLFNQGVVRDFEVSGVRVLYSRAREHFDAVWRNTTQIPELNFRDTRR